MSKKSALYKYLEKFVDGPKVVASSRPSYPFTRKTVTKNGKLMKVAEGWHTTVSKAIVEGYIEAIEPFGSIAELTEKGRDFLKKKAE